MQNERAGDELVRQAAAGINRVNESYRPHSEMPAASVCRAKRTWICLMSVWIVVFPWYLAMRRKIKAGRTVLGDEAENITLSNQRAKLEKPSMGKTPHIARSIFARRYF
jgi:hypothetical protein